MDIKAKLEDNIYSKELDKLTMSLGEVYELPLFKTMSSFEKEREKLLKSNIDTFTSKEIQSTLKNMEIALGSSSMQDVFNREEDYLKYTTPILDEIHKNDYEKLQKSLEVDIYEKYMKDDIAHTFKSLNIVDDTLNRINETSEIDLKKYASSFNQSFEDLTDNKNFLESSQSLLDISGEINKDKFKYDMKKLNREIPQYTPPLKLPNPTNYGKKIIESFKIQKGSLDMISNHMETQNQISKEQIDINKLLSNKQIKALDEQIKQNKVSAEQQNKDTKMMMYITIFIALVSIAIAIWTGVSSIIKADELYDKGNISSNQQHEELLNRLDSLKNEDTSKEQIKILKAMLATMEKNNEAKVDGSK